jgi:Cu/Ag efflux pump CusA
MTRWAVGSSLRFSLLVAAAAVAFLVVGVVQLRDMPVAALPEFVPPTVEIQTEALGLSATEVEQLITVPLEQDLLNGVAFLDDIRSESVSGLSRVLLVFEPGTDLFQARQVVAERMTQAHALPHVSKPPQMLQPLSSANRVMMVGLSSKDVPALDMSVLARWTIVPRLVGVPGVANVSVWGQRDRQLQVQVDPERLRDEGVTLLQVLETTGNALWVSPLTFVEASTPGSGGFIDTANQRLSIQHLSPITTPGDLAKMRVEGAKSLRLGDVASVVEDHQPLIGDAIVDGGAGLMLVVEKLPEANTLEVTRGVERAIEALQPGLAGIEFDSTVYRQASYVDKAIDNLTLAVFVGAALLALVVLAFLGWRSALICVVVIPLSLVAAALVLWALGTTMNLIVLTGLATALILVIDDVVIDTDNIVRRMRGRGAERGASTTESVILDASLELRRPAVYATLVVGLAALPAFFFDGGLAGAFFPDLVGVFLLALFASLAVAVCVTPAFAVLLLSSEPRESPLGVWLVRGYERALSAFVRRRWPAYVAFAGIAAAGVAAVPFLSQSLLPRLEERDVLVRFEGAPGTSLPEMNRIAGRASRELRAIPGVRDVGAHVGRAVTGDQVVGINSGELWVSIDEAAGYDSTLAAVREVIAGYPGVSGGVQTHSEERLQEILTGTDRDVVVRVYGENLRTLAAEASKVREAVSEVSGIENASVELPAAEPTLEIEVNLARAQQYGIKPGDVRRAAATLVSGLHVGSLFEEQKVFDVVVWGTPKTRNSLNSVRRLLIDTPDGGHVRLDAVADVRIAPNPAIVKREAVSRYLDVGASVTGRDRGDVVSDVENRLEALSFPLEYHAEVLADESQPVGRLLALGVTAAVGIFLLLQAFFGSWRLAVLTSLSLPVALSGGLVAALATGGTLSFGSYLALVAVFGFATRGGVILIDRCRRLVKEGVKFGPELVLRASRERVAPVTVTALAAVLALAPLAIMGDVAGLEPLGPMAVVGIGGLVTALALNLFLLPVLYLRFGLAPERAADAEVAPDADLAAELV